MPEAWRWTWTWELNGIPHAQNVLHVIPTASFRVPTQGDADDLKTALENATSGSPNAFRQKLASNWTLAAQSLQAIDQPNRPVFETTTTRNGQGSSDALPRMLSLVFKLGTESTFNGRIFVPGYDEAQSTATGPPIAAAADATIAFFNALQGEMNTLLYEWVVYSRTRDEVAPVVSFTRSGSSAARGWQRQTRRALPLR